MSEDPFAGLINDEKPGNSGINVGSGGGMNLASFSQ
jgi:hypothetical protein